MKSMFESSLRIHCEGGRAWHKEHTLKELLSVCLNLSCVTQLRFVTVLLLKHTQQQTQVQCKPKGCADSEKTGNYMRSCQVLQY